MQFEALKVGELARRTGLSVRTLHHYDEIGLLKPSHHTESGHRLYTKSDIVRLQQVLSIRELGFSLIQVRDCLDEPGFSPLEVIRLHIARLRQQINLQAKLCERLEGLADHFRTVEEVSTDDFIRTIEEMTMIQKQFEEVAKLVGPDEVRAIETSWTALMAEVRANQHLDPASPEAQTLLTRWEELTERTMHGYQGFPELKQTIADGYKQGKFEGHAHAPQQADSAFIERLKAARQAAGGNGKSATQQNS